MDLLLPFMTRGCYSERQGKCALDPAQMVTIFNRLTQAC